MYVGMQADIETQSAAMSFMPHRRWSSVVGARSGLTWNRSRPSVETCAVDPGSRLDGSTHRDHPVQARHGLSGAMIAERDLIA